MTLSIIKPGDYIVEKLYKSGTAKTAQFMEYRIFIVLEEYKHFYLCVIKKGCYKECFLKKDLKSSKTLRHVKAEGDNNAETQLHLTNLFNNTYDKPIDNSKRPDYFSSDNQ